MNAENCVLCRFCEKKKGITKSKYICKFGRYKELGYPISWLRKCPK